MKPRSRDKNRPGAVTTLAAMPWGTRTALAALVAALVAGCGSGDDKSIPPDASDQLIAQLHQVEDQVQAGNCELAQGQATQFKTSVENLPGSVDSDTQKDLTKLADNLVALADNPEQCASEGATGESGVAPSESSSTETSTTETPTSTSTTTTTEPEEEQQPSTPSGQGPGESQGNPSPSSQGTGGALGGNGASSGGIGVKPKKGGSANR